MKTYSVILFKNGIRWHSHSGVLPSGVKIWIDGFVNSDKFDKISIKEELKL